MGSQRVTKALGVGALVFACASLQLSCAGPFSNALENGDEYMNARMWDRAAESYERAVQLDPASSEARVKLQQARARQAHDRMSRAEVLVRRGAFESALALSHEAALLDPASTEVQAAFNGVIDAAVAEAYRLVAVGQFEPALAMSTTILRYAPGHPGALEVDGRVRRTIAARHDERADAFLRAGRVGSALVELTLALGVQPDDAARRARRQHVLQRLRDDVRFFVVLDASGGAPDLLSVLRGDALAAVIDPRLAIAVDQRPPEGAMRGVRIGGSEPRFELASKKSAALRSCDYVCGSDTRPNPAHALAERSVADLERELATLEERVARAERQVDDRQREVDEAERELSRAETNADRERERLERCLASGSTDRPPSCDSERNASDSAQRDVTRARDRLSHPRDRLTAARRDLASEREDRNRARHRRDVALATMRDTPRTIEVDRICEHAFQAQLHELTGDVRFELRVAPLGRRLDEAPREAIARAAREHWETWDASPGRCPREAKRAPVPLPSDATIRARLVLEVTNEAGRHVLAAFDVSRRAWFDEGVAAEAEGRVDDAVDSYVKYLVAGAGTGDPGELRRIGDCLRRERSLVQPNTLLVP